MVHITWVLRWTLTLILRQRIIFWICIVTNMVGVVVGTVWWYGPMLQQSPWWTWLFIPDCPLAALVATIALLALSTSRRWPTFNAFVTFACMKYGAWTILFWLRHWSSADAIYPIEVMLFVTHIGLFIEGLLFVPHIGPLVLPKRLAVLGWFVLSLVVDYGLGYHPPLTSYVPVTFVFWTASVLTTLLGIALLSLPYGMDHRAARWTIRGSYAAVDRNN